MVMTCSYYVLALLWFDRHVDKASTEEAATSSSGEIAKGRNLEMIATC